MSDPRLAEYLQFLRFPSISTDPERKGDVAACAAWLEKKLTGMGLATKVVPTAGHPIVLAKNEHKPGRRTVMIYGHYDVAELMAKLGFTGFDEVYASRLGELGRLRQHGVTVVTGVDSGMGPPKRHGNAWRAVGEFAEGGYPVAEALAAATSVAAAACGLAGETGRLAEGYAADVLVVDGDLAQDPTLLSTPREVQVRGTVVDLH